jgi:RNA polymerase sigma factor for flagellar operon FliA
VCVAGASLGVGTNRRAASADSGGPSLRARERERLLAEHLPQVRYIARRIHGRLPRNVQLEDLIHEGVIGLIDALDKFDPLKQVQLKSYAQFRIRGAILDSLRASDWSPRSLRAKARQLEKKRLEMSAALGRSLTDSELAGYLGMELPDFARLLAELHALDLCSLEATGKTEGRELPDHHPDGPVADPFSLCLRGELKSRLLQAMAGLGERERQVLTLYYAEELTMKEVGAALGIGESRVSQIHSAAIVRLRGWLQCLAQSEPVA